MPNWRDDELPEDDEIKGIVEQRTKDTDKGHGPDQDGWNEDESDDE